MVRRDFHKGELEINYFNLYPLSFYDLTPPTSLAAMAKKTSYTQILVLQMSEV